MENNTAGIVDVLKGIGESAKYPTWEALMQNGTNREKFDALVHKFMKWVDADDVRKVTAYYIDLISLPFEECPEEYKPVFSKVKRYLKNKLYL